MCLVCHVLVRRAGRMMCSKDTRHEETGAGKTFTPSEAPNRFLLCVPKGLPYLIILRFDCETACFYAPGNQPSVLLLVLLIYIDARPVWTYACVSVTAVLTCFS